MKRQHRALIAVLLIACGGGLVWWLRERPAPVDVAAVPVPAAPVAAAGPLPPVAAAPASAPAIRHPVEAIEALQGPPDAATILSDLFGRKAVDALLVSSDFPMRVAATVDNLGRAQVSSRLWPARPTAGHFTVGSNGSATVIAADNELRYAPFLILVESVDMARIVKAYKQLYPQIQTQYQNLGYPDRYFNDRLVDVVDSMLATPEPTGPFEVRLPNTAVGSAAPLRPWILYEFADPALAALPSGQKLLLRLGPVGERRMKTRLAELRRLIAPPAADR